MNSSTVARSHGLNGFTTQTGGAAGTPGPQGPQGGGVGGQGGGVGGQGGVGGHGRGGLGGSQGGLRPAQGLCWKSGIRAIGSSGAQQPGFMGGLFCILFRHPFSRAPRAAPAAEFFPRGALQSTPRGPLLRR